MNDIVPAPAQTLYDEDFYAWTQAQAALLRAGQLGQANIANIIEEIETLGRQEVAGLRSRFRVLAHHLLKEIYLPEEANRRGAATIVGERQELAWQIADSPSLETRAAELFAEAYAAARQIFAVEAGLSLHTFPVEPPFSYRQAVNEAFWPGRTVEDRS